MRLPANSFWYTCWARMAMISPRMITKPYNKQSPVAPRSEEHTSELQSRPHLVCRLLLEKKKKINKQPINTTKHKTSLLAQQRNDALDHRYTKRTRRDLPYT